MEITEERVSLVPPKGVSRHILVVDDEPSIRNLLKRILSKSSHTVKTASDGAKAMKILSDESCDLAVIDLNMPGMNGETLLNEIRRNDRDISLIVLTGNRDLSKAYTLLQDFEISDFLQKPLKNPSQLLFSVENALEKRRIQMLLRKRTQAVEVNQRNLESQVTARTRKIEDVVARLRSEIAERKQIEEQLIEARDEAQAASQAKSDFLALMSHELRTPLNHIIGFTQLVVAGRWGAINEEQEEHLGHAIKSSKYLLSLINDILDLAKIEAGRMDLDIEAVNIIDLLTNSLVMVRDAAMEKRIRLATDVVGIPPTAAVDERKMKQIIYNLLSNAVKFTAERGTITLKARMVEHDSVSNRYIDRENTSEMNANAPIMIISVIDDGIGILPENSCRIFDPFEQAKRTKSSKAQGTGLGLSLVKNLVEMHGGQIWVESQGENRGSDFSFAIPVRSVPSEI